MISNEQADSDILQSHTDDNAIVAHNPLLGVYPILIFGLLANGVGQSMLYSILAPIARQINLAEFQVGIILAVSAATTAVLSPLWGRIADKWGRKPVFVFALAAYGMTSVVFGLLLSLALGNVISGVFVFAALLVSRMAYAALTAGLQPAAMAIAVTASSKETRASRIALVSGAFSIGLVIGPVMGGGLAAFYLVAPIYLGAVITLLASGLAWQLLVRGKQHPSDRKTAINSLKFYDRRVLFVFLSAVVFFVSYSAIQQTVPFYVQRQFNLPTLVAAQSVGLAMTALASAMVLAQWGCVSWLNWRPQALALCGCGFATVGLLLLVGSSTIIVIYISLALMGFGFGFTYPAIQASASMSVEPDEQGAAAGVMGMAAAIGYIVGPVIGTGLYSFFERLPFIAAIFLVLLCLAFHLVNHRANGASRKL